MTQRATLRGHTDTIRNMIWSADSKFLAVNTDKESKVWDAVNGNERLNFTDAGVQSMSPDSTTMVAVKWSVGMEVWDLPTGKLRMTLSGVLGYGVFAPDSQTLAVTTTRGRGNVTSSDVKVWNVAAVGPRIVKGPQLARRITPQGKVLDFVDYPKALHVWDAFSGHKLGSLEGPFPAAYTTPFSPDGGTLVDWDWTGGTLKIRDVATGKLRGTVKFGEPLEHMETFFAQSGRMMLALTKGGQVCVVDLVAAAELCRFKGKGGVVGWAAFSPDGKILAWPNQPPYTVGGQPLVKPKIPPKFHTPPKEKPPPLDPIDGEVLLIETASGRELANLTGHKDVVRAVIFSPDGKTLASQSKGEIRLWDVAQAKLRCVLKITGDPASWHVVFSADSSLIAAPDYPQGIKVWETAGGELRTVLPGSKALNAIAFTPDGKTLLTTAGDGKEVSLWDPVTGHLRAMLAEPMSLPIFSRDSRALVSITKDRVYQWQAAAAD
jgi:WD40 repeat protein